MSTQERLTRVDPVTDEDRCQLTELLTDQCDHCRHGVRQRQVAELFDTPGDDRVVATFAANWPGLCDNCGDDFDAGDLIARTSAGEYHCGRCA